MKYLLQLVVLAGISILQSCDKNNLGQPFCNSFELNEPFTAKIGEEWCLEGSDWKIRFGPFIEDSRCNVPGITCFWAGRYVMAATVDNGETIQDTFYAEINWSDTLYLDRQIILSKVYPETRISMEPLDTSKYSFDIIVK